jgi:NAD(P)-dependent dehydrogenase (short-subunit alcohol dehydrogenase family)
MEKLCREKARGRSWTFKQMYAEYVEDTALRRVTAPQVVANSVLFLCGEDGRAFACKELVPDGGWDI